MRLLAGVLLILLPSRQTEPPPALAARLEHAYHRVLPTRAQPYVLEVTNTLGRDLDLRLSVNSGEGLKVTRQETLSRGAKKRLFFYLDPLFRHLPQFVISDASGAVLAQGTADHADAPGGGNSIYSLLLMSGDKGSSSAFWIPHKLASRDVAVERVGPANVPDRWVGLSGLDAILLHDFPLDDLTPEQARALADYVAQGGTVILSPGSNRAWLNHPTIAALAPVRAGDPKEFERLVSLDRFGPLPRARFVLSSLSGGDTILSETDGTRTLVVYRQGFGRVIVLPFDVRRPPFDSWPGLEKLWEHLFMLPSGLSTAPPELFYAQDDPFRADVLSGVSTIVNAYPPFGLLVGLAFLFILVVGPVNYMLLRRARTTLLVIVTVPAVSFVFMLVVLGVGYVLKGTTTITHTITVLKTRSGERTAQEARLFTVFSPSARTYDIRFDRGMYAYPLESFSGRGRYEEAPPLEVSQNEPHTIRNFAIGQWQSAHFVALSMRDLEGGVTFEADRGKVKITNRTPYAIKRGVYLEVGRGGFSSPFGEVPPGRTIEAPIDSTKYRPLAALGFEPESFGAKALAAHFDRLDDIHRGSPGARMTRLLFCLVEGVPGEIALNASTSGRSESLAFLQVLEAGK